MIAFLSCSLDESEYFLITLLSQRFDKNGMTLFCNITSEDSNYILRNLNVSTFYFGIITNQGTNNKQVIKQYKHAKKNKIPAILMVEDRVSVPNLKEVIIFDRDNIKDAMELVNKNKIKCAKKISKFQHINELTWIIGESYCLDVLKLLGNPEGKFISQKFKNILFDFFKNNDNIKSIYIRDESKNLLVYNIILKTDNYVNRSVFYDFLKQHPEQTNSRYNKVTINFINISMMLVDRGTLVKLLIRGKVS